MHIDEILQQHRWQIDEILEHEKKALPQSPLSIFLVVYKVQNTYGKVKMHT